MNVQVEQHNSQIQQSFAQRMDGAFSDMQRRVQQQGTKHHDMLSSYSQAVGESSYSCRTRTVKIWDK